MIGTFPLAPRFGRALRRPGGRKSRLGLGLGQFQGAESLRTGEVVWRPPWRGFARKSSPTSEGRSSQLLWGKQRQLRPQVVVGQLLLQLTGAPLALLPLLGPAPDLLVRGVWHPAQQLPTRAHQPRLQPGPGLLLQHPQLVEPIVGLSYHVGRLEQVVVPNPVDLAVTGHGPEVGAMGRQYTFRYDGSLLDVEVQRLALATRDLHGHAPAHDEGKSGPGFIGVRYRMPADSVL
mmetsp:Transcript_82873/g.115127  ORF Transcript_82873/g.115127 Transcript_82873/m.115127 type:complete len:233 (+) Transcript_82873:92-790(+)